MPYQIPITCQLGNLIRFFTISRGLTQHRLPTDDAAMHSYLDVAIIGAFVVVYGLFSARLTTTPLTGPILFCLFGWLVGNGGLGWVDLHVSGQVVKVLAELTLVCVLFTDASRIDLRILRHNIATPLRLLGIGLPLTILAGLCVGVWLFPTMSLWSVAILATILAPTDAALGEAVIDHEEIPLRVRQSLNVESGLNDGICVPILSILIAGALTLTDHPQAIIVAAKAIGYAVGIGFVLALIGAKLVDWAAHVGWIGASYRRLAMIGIPLSIFAVTQLVDGSGFIAAFVSGLTVGSLLKRCDADQFEAVQDSSDLLSLITWVIFGGTFVPLALSNLTWPVVVYSLFSLTLVRMIPVAIALIGTKFRWYTISLIGWFGPRGLASIVFTVMVLDQKGIVAKEAIGAVVAWTVFLSIFAHGLTSNFLATLYGKQCQKVTPDKPEMVPVLHLRTRR